jgi:GT2 family glycosyltransferase/SAM-dependent methyltransferase
MSEPTRTYRVVQAAPGVDFTGERFVPGVKGAIEVEHLHRYLFALQFCAGKTVLDIACGEGYGSKLLTSVAASVVGIDIDEASVARAVLAYGSDSMRFLAGRADAIPLPDASIDVAVSFETVEHMAEQAAFIGELARVLRPGGVLVMSSPDRFVYDRVNDGPNEFHIKELSTREFKDLLAGHFSQIALGFQKIAIGSIILPGAASAAKAAMEHFKRTDSAVERSADLLEAPYVVAVASNLKLPPILWSSYEDFAILEGMQRDHSAQMAALQSSDEQLLATVRRQSEAQLADGQLISEARLAEAQRQAEVRLAEALLDVRTAFEARIGDIESAHARLLQAQVRESEVKAHESETGAREAVQQAQVEAEAARLALEQSQGARAAVQHALAATQGRVSELEAEIERLRKKSFGRRLARLPGAPYREARRVVRRLRNAWERRRGVVPAIAARPGPILPQPIANAAAACAPDNDRDDYEIVAEAVRAQRQARIEAFAPENLPQMIQCPKDRLEAFAAALALPPAPADPDVSIIIPVYNAPTYVLECLAALAAHATQRSFEVILIDDASDAETAGLLPHVRNVRLIRNETNLGFLLTCNRALEHARGRFTLFLNSDTQVQAGWLDALIAPFDEETAVGAVGPKLVYPNGRLQEAGAIINRDATASLVGLFDDPAAPRYNRRREVDYCSGAGLVVETKVVKALGGFDPHFAPAYCEDSDLCLRLRAKGLRIFYEPKAVIAHHLSVSTNGISDDYKRDLAIRNQQKLLERWGAEIDKLNDVRVIAHYLPQFHPIPENDLWWGKGFTEWSNVAKATPNFLGHNQPNVPTDLGFYDLRMAEAMQAQADLARRYGVHGFCFYYYWFAGRRLLEQPLDHLLAGKVDMPFCVGWANENWTRHWDGQDREILMGQNHSAEDDIAVITDMARYLRHPNYIRVNGRPLVIVYRPSILPDARVTAELWRSECRGNGVGEIYLAMVDSFNQVAAIRTPTDIGFDAVIEFPPHNTSEEMAPPGPLLNANFAGVVQDYRRVVTRYTGRELPDYPFFRSVMPRWDNTPRQQDRPHVFHHATPGAYRAWLESAVRDARQTSFGDEALVFVNAWNEWAEGAYLEPDKQYGHRFLEATRDGLEGWLLGPRG